MAMLHSKNYIWFTTTGEYFPIKKWDDFPVIEKPTNNRIPYYELLDIFPDAGNVIKQAIKNDKFELSNILKKHEAIKKWWFIHALKRNKLDLIQELAIVCFGNLNRMEELQKRIDINTNILKSRGTGNSQSTILKAKSVPINTFIQFDNAGFAKCIWHNEKTPSMKYYPKDNRVHCFGSCNRNGDAIDAMQALHGISVREAIKKLCNL